MTPIELCNKIVFFSFILFLFILLQSSIGVKLLIELYIYKCGLYLKISKNQVSGHSPSPAKPTNNGSLHKAYRSYSHKLQLSYIKPQRNETINFFRPKAFPFRKVSLIRNIYYLNFESSNPKCPSSKKCTIK